MSREVIARLDGAYRYYETARRSAVVHALEPITLDIAAGECLGVVGESGSGKSTLGRVISRLVRPTGGRVYFRGNEIGELGDRAMRKYRRHLQMIFQDAYSSLNPRMRVDKAIIEAARYHHVVDPARLTGYVGDLLTKVGLSEQHGRRFPRGLSGGQRQRAVVARALSVQPELVIADEAVSALDVSVQAGILTLLRSIQRSEGLTLVFISHDISVVEYLSDRVLVMYLGRVMEIASVDALYAAPLHPYTRGLLESVPGHGITDATFPGETPSQLAPPSGCVFRTRCRYAVAECALQVPELREVAPGRLVACIRDEAIWDGQTRPAKTSSQGSGPEEDNE